MSEGDLQKQLELLKRIEALETIAKQYLTHEAISRYYTLKAAHPDIAIKAATVIAQAGQQGQFPQKLTDAEFKRILMQLQEPKREFKIRR